MKKELRKHLQMYCNVSNWSRMRKPKAGKANYEAGKALAEDVLRLLMRNEPGYDGTAIMLTALALVRSYVRKAVCHSNAFDCTEHFHLLERYEDLFVGDWWMKLRDDRIMNEISYYVMSSAYYVMSSVVERSSFARLLPEGRKKSHEISPCANA